MYRDRARTADAVAQKHAVGTSDHTHRSSRPNVFFAPYSPSPCSPSLDNRCLTLVYPLCIVGRAGAGRLLPPQLERLQFGSGAVPHEVGIVPAGRRVQQQRVSGPRQRLQLVVKT